MVTGELSPAQAKPVTDLLIAESLWRRAVKKFPDLTNLDGLTRTARVTEFRELDQRRIRVARQEVLGQYLQRRPNGFAGEMGIIRQEIEKKRGHRALRRLMKDAGTAVQQLKPAFFDESPISCTISAAGSVNI